MAIREGDGWWSRWGYNVGCGSAQTKMNACGKLAASLRQARRKLAKLNFTLYKLAASLHKLAKLTRKNAPLSWRPCFSTDGKHLGTQPRHHVLTKKNAPPTKDHIF
ncbi:hypothetical protein DPMN_019839 [Dreissena polymorpha]|uniref:Uncharacterized protein n=1 Tax=Dreissena polymorpha TaxID=45954 RepID=A0A9D4NL54_DREPO|nr:hypothetical protein DPMN_019839 [Dreissena polymorpha]